MGFFTRKQKRFAKRKTYYDLQQGYKESDRALEHASYTGDSKALKAAMKAHRQYEYALLYRNTPEFKRTYKDFR